MRAVRHIEADCRGQRGALDAAVGPDDRHAFDPRHVADQVADVEIAGVAARHHGHIGARRHLQHGADGGDDFALAFGAVPGQLEHLGRGRRNALAAARLEQPDPVDHERNDREQQQEADRVQRADRVTDEHGDVDLDDRNDDEQGQHDQATPDAQKRGPRLVLSAAAESCNHRHSNPI